jgi:prophage regulatory protein
MPSQHTPQTASNTKKVAALPMVKADVQPAGIPNFDDLPDSAWIRQSHLVRDPKHPTRPTPLPFSPATFWRLVADQKFPQPTKLSARVTAWKVGEVRAWLNEQARAA